MRCLLAGSHISDRRQTRVLACTNLAQPLSQLYKKNQLRKISHIAGLNPSWATVTAHCRQKLSLESIAIPSAQTLTIIHYQTKPNQTNHTKCNLPNQTYRTWIRFYWFPVVMTISCAVSGVLVWCERVCVAWVAVAWFFEWLTLLKQITSGSVVPLAVFTLFWWHRKNIRGTEWKSVS